MRNLYGSENFNPASRFLREIPEELTVEVRTGGNVPRTSKSSSRRISGEVPDT